VVGAVMLFRCGLSCNGNHENGERECQSFHEDLCLYVFIVERTRPQLDP
jgi:hypothetical protein